MNRVLRSAAFLAGVIVMTAPAWALEPKQCLPMAAMNAALQAEGQRTLIIGNRVAFRDSPERPSGAKVEKWMNAYTANAEHSRGFNIEGDRPMGEPSTKACIAGKFTNIGLYDARQPGTPEAAKRGADFDTSLRDNEAKGTRPMLQADSISTGPDGSIRTGLGITLFGNMRVKVGYLVANYPGGKSADMMFMGDTQYTPTAIARLDAARR